MSPQDPKKHPDLGSHFSTDNDLNEVWPVVVAEYEKVTGEKLDSNTTFQSFQQTVTETLRKARSKRTSDAKTILSNIGKCLQQFGSIAAGGASTVFAPSAQCWSAISIVIGAAQKFSDVLDGFVTLMERCLAFFSRLNRFLEREFDSCLPIHLRQPAYEILAHFIDILKSSYKLTKSKRERFKLVVDIVLFSGDAEVKSSLEFLEQRVQDFTNAQIDEILVGVRGLTRYLHESYEAILQNQIEIREDWASRCKVDEEILAVSQQTGLKMDIHMNHERFAEDKENIRKTFLLKPNEDPWVKRHDYICKTRIEHSGRWILERKELGFAAWAALHDRQSKTKVLTVEGDPGFGKTFISNKVISYLQDTYRNNATSDRVSIAYYYYGEDKEESLEKCIRCIIYQFACAEPAYAQAVAEACKQSAGIARAEDIWERLIVKLQHTMKATYYICIDGFQDRDVDGNAGETIATIARNILSDIKGIPIRLYLSGTNEALAQIPQDNSGVQRIPLGPVKYLGNKPVRLSASENDESPATISLVNASDLQAIAIARVEEIGKKKPELKGVMTDANIKKLVDGVRGHYEHLEAKMIQINACDTEQMVQDVINSFDEDLKTSVRSSLELFSKSLSVEQIGQLNKLLVWIVGGIDPSIDLLQSALYLAFRKTFMLRDLIGTKFSGLLTLENNRVKLKSDQVLQILREGNQSHLRFTRSGSTTTELSEAEINLCRNIVKNVCGEHVYSQFHFADFFNSLAGKQNVSLQIDEENALDVAITRLLLQALCESNDETHLDGLRRYAAVWLYQHLQYFVKYLDCFEPDRESLTEIGSKLSHVLYNAEGIELWSSENLGTVKQVLVVEDDFIDALLKILRNPHAVLGYEQDVEKKKWIQSVISGRSNKYALFEKIAGTLATKWFSCKTLTNREYFWVLYGIFCRIKTGKFDPDDTMPSLVEVADFLKWVQEHNNLDTTNVLWKYCVGATYLILAYNEEALCAFKEAECELDGNWAFLLSIAEAHTGRKDFPAALEYLHKVKELYPTLIDTDKEFKEAYWERVLLPEANCHREIKENDAAVKCYRNILDQDIGSKLHSSALAALFALWMEIGDYVSIMSFLRDLRDDKKSGKGLSYWLNDVLGYDDNIHGYIIAAAQHLTAIEEVSQMYDEVIKLKLDEISKTQSSENSDENMRYIRAAMKFYGSQLHHDHEDALSVWEEMALNPADTWDTYWIGYKSCRLLARSLLDKGAAELSKSVEPTTSITYVARLEALSRSNKPAVRDNRQTMHDPCFCLIKLHLLNGNDKLAHEEARSLIRGIFDGWPEDPHDQSLRLRYGTLAQVLTVFNLDDDAVAAWQAREPRGIELTATEARERPTTLLEADEKGGQDLSSRTDATQPANKPLASPTPKAKAYVFGYICDGCNRCWDDVLDDCWACKHCLCVQLCSPCHDKLPKRQLSPLVCSPEHEFLYLRKIDKELWSSMPDDMILLGGKSTPRDQWLGQFRKRWDVQQEQIDAYKLETARKLKATICIGRYVVKWKRSKSERNKKIKRARTFPLLRGH